MFRTPLLLAQVTGTTPTPLPTVQPTPLPTPQPFIKINFQPASAAVPTGYLVDSGAKYGSYNGQTYGWTKDMSKTSRDRNSALSPDQRYDSLVHMYLVDKGTTYKGSWELAVPNGTYSVRLVVGDPDWSSQSADSKRQIVYAEDVTLINGSIARTAPWLDQTAIVTVKDGRLTLTSGMTGSTPASNRLCFIEITRIP